MLRWNLGANFFIRNLYLWKEGNESRLRQRKITTVQARQNLSHRVRKSGMRALTTCAPQPAKRATLSPPITLSHQHPRKDVTPVRWLFTAGRSQGGWQQTVQWAHCLQWHVPFLTGSWGCGSVSITISLRTYCKTGGLQTEVGKTDPLETGKNIKNLNVSSTLSSVIIIYCCSVAKSYLILCDPMDCSKPGFPVLHFLSEFAQTRVHWISDVIQPSHPLSPPSPPALDLSQWVLSHFMISVLY